MSRRINQNEVTHLSPRQEPDIRKLFHQMETQLSSGLTGAQSVTARMEDAYDTFHCYWADQNATGTKTGEDANPYEGASDVRIRVAEEVINERMLVKKAAFIVGKMAVTPGMATSNNSPEQSGLVMAVMNHTWGQMRTVIRDALNYLLLWQETYGHSLLHICWREERDIEKRTVTVQQLMQLAVDAELVAVGLPETGDMKQAVEGGQEIPPEILQQAGKVAEMTVEAMDPILYEEDREEDLLALLATHDPDMTMDEARRVIRELREGEPGEEIEYWAPYVKSARPHWEALMPFVDVFYPLDTTTIQTARWVARVHWLSRVELEARAEVEGWDPEWLETVLKQPGRAFDNIVFQNHTWVLGGMGVRRALVDHDLQSAEVYQIIEMHYRAMAMAGVPCIYRAILHGSVQDKAGWHEPNPYEHGQMPYVAFRRDYIEPLLVASRGVAEMLATQQAAIKGQHDARRDRTALATNPPAIVPQFRAGGRYRIGPGEQIPERRTGQVRFLETPRQDQDTVAITKEEWALVARMFGRFSPDVPQPVTQLHQQGMVADFLTDMTEAVRQTYKLLRQYRTDEWAFRITGIETVFHASRETLQADTDFTLSYDPMDMDLEWLKSKLGLIGEIVLPLDSEGATDRTKLLQFAFTAVDPGLASQVLRNTDTLQQDELEDEQRVLTEILSGLEPRFKQGQNHSGRKGYLIQMAQTSPPVMEKLQENETVRALFEARVAMHDQQVTQDQNRIVGRLGAKPVLGGAAA